MIGLFQTLHCNQLGSSTSSHQIQVQGVATDQVRPPSFVEDPDLHSVVVAVVVVVVVRVVVVVAATLVIQVVPAGLEVPVGPGSLSAEGKNLAR